MRTARRIVLSLFMLIAPAAPLSAWDGHGHRVITSLAFDGLAKDSTLPDWLKQKDACIRAMYQSVEPDRWRGQRTPALIHENSPDHFLDIEDLELFGLTIETMPNLRYEYIRVMALAKAAHPECFTSYDPALDPHKDKEWPGFVAHSIIEHYAKLQASFRTLRIMEAAGIEGRDNQHAQARANVIHHIGILSHFVGDAAQPLHTTRHFNGWMGEPGTPANPNAYTTSNRFHSYIDGGVVELHKITHESLAPRMTTSRTVNAADPWIDIINHLKRSHAKMEDLYRMEKDGTLDLEPGKKLIEERLIDGADMLRALVAAAWNTSEPEDGEIRRFMGWTPVE